MTLVDGDTFVRINQVNWGAATGSPLGSSWSHPRGTSNNNIASNKGTADTNSAAYNVNTLGSKTLKDFDITVNYTPGTSGDSGGPIARYTDNNNWYYSDIGNLGQFAEIGKDVGGAFTTIASAAFTWSAGTTYSMRFKGVGTKLFLKVWTGAEPAGWTVTGTDGSLTTAGNFGLGYDPAGATALKFDTFSVDDTLNPKDIATRFRLASSNQLKDLATRFRLASASQLKNIATRFRLQSANQFKDIATRFRLQSASQLKDVTTRFRLQSANQLKDIATRFRLQSASQLRDIATRFRLQATSLKDTSTRFRLQSSAQFKDISARFRLQSASQLRDIATRFRLASANQLRDIAFRIRLQSANQLRDLATRFRLSAGSLALKDIACRFRLAGSLPVPTLVVVATFRSGTVEATYRDGQQEATHRDGNVIAGGR